MQIDLTQIIRSGVEHLQRADYLKAVKSFRSVLQQEPGCVDAHFGLAEALLTLGKWKEGFSHYDWRLRRPQCALTQYNLPIWNGEALSEGRLLIQGEQGLGDSIQFARYVPWATARAGSSVFVAQPQLVPLLAPLREITQLVSDGDQINRIAAWVPLLSLPRYHESSVTSVPEPLDYSLSGSASQKKTWSLPERPQVGLVWRTNKIDSATARNKSLPLEALRPLLELKSVKWVSLQQQMTKEEIHLFQREYAGEVDPRRLDCFTQTAAWMRELDLVITLDSATAHLAGSVAGQCWTMLAYRSDWRWLVDREDSVWYPNMKLFRCKNPGQWDEVVHRLKQELTRQMDKQTRS